MIKFCIIYCKYDKKYDEYRNSEFKGKLEIGNKSVAEFDTKFIKLFVKSDSTQRFLQDFVQSSAIQINLISNSAADLLPISSFPLNSEELLYDNFRHQKL